MAELKKLMIETSVDRLVDLVRRKRSVTLDSAASGMGVSVDQVEDWVRILEDHGYVKLIYPPIGEPRIVIADLPDEFFVEKTAEFEKRKALLEQRAQKFETLVSGVSRKVEVDDAHFKQVESELRKKLEDAEKRLANLQRLESLKTKIKQETGELDSAAKNAIDEFDRVQVLVKDLDKKVNDSLSRMDKFGRDMDMINGEKTMIEGEIKSLDREIKMVQRLGEKRMEIPMVKDIMRLFERQKGKIKKIEIKRDHIGQKAKKIKHVKEKRLPRIKHLIKRHKKHKLHGRRAIHRERKR